MVAAVLTSIRVFGGSRSSQRSRSIAIAQFARKARGPEVDRAERIAADDAVGLQAEVALQALHRRDHLRASSGRRRAADALAFFG